MKPAKPVASKVLSRLDGCVFYYKYKQVSIFFIVAIGIQHSNWKCFSPIIVRLR